MPAFVCAVDVGTGSARAGIFDAAGNLHGRADAPLLMRQPRTAFAEQSSAQIWSAVAAAVNGARAAADVAAADVAGIAFDATCSLVVRGRDGAALPVSPGGDAAWDTIAWLDHRALAEADECTRIGGAVVALAGGAMSPEMQTPKLMWLKRHLGESWRAAGAIYDLADYLSFCASGSNARSQATLAPKWPYLGGAPAGVEGAAAGWADEFLRAVGLDDLVERAALPSRAVPLATDVGPLSPAAAEALGLTTRCRVGAGLVDAYAGALSVLGGLPAAERDGQLALVAGTSSCVMMAAPAAEPRPAVWGPYADVGLPGLWMSEAGQSATGALLDHIVRSHRLEPDAPTHARIASRILELREAEGPAFASRLHVLPDFHGNRAPLGDPHALGVVSGLSLDGSFDGLCRLYWRTCVGIALGLRHIVERLRAAGLRADALHVAGGHLKNPLLMELYADATHCAIIESGAADAVLLGTAMVAAAACEMHADLAVAAQAMAKDGQPRPAVHPDRYERDWRVFLTMHAQRKALEAI